MHHLRRLLHALLNVLLPLTDTERAIAVLSSEDLSRMMHVENRGGVVSLFEYHNPPIRDLIWVLKYKGNRKAAELCGEILGAYLQEKAEGARRLPARSAQRGTPREYYIIPIPLSSARRRKRGFNQAELIARTLNTPRGTVLTRTLVKTRDTPPQTGLKRARRLTNLRGAFSVRDPSRIAGSVIVLIDDVTTTGSTLKEARRTLLDAGAKRVHAVALARS